MTLKYLYAGFSLIISNFNNFDIITSNKVWLVFFIVVVNTSNTVFMNFKGEVENRWVNKWEWDVWSHLARDVAGRILRDGRQHVGRSKDDSDRDHKACGGDRDEIDGAEIEKDDFSKGRENQKKTVGCAIVG